MTRELRDYQRDAVGETYKAWKDGMTRPAVVMATGLGKTDCIAQILTDCARDGGRALAIAHRGELLDQITARARMHDATIPVGRVQAGRNETRRPITVASMQSLSEERTAKLLPRGERYDVIIVDECFPAGTLVGDVPIESIRTGDYVDSWDELAARPVRRRVLATMRSRPSSLIRVSAGTDVVVCTPGHPFLTLRGWLPASHLTKDDHVIASRPASGLRTVHGVRGAGSSQRAADPRTVATSRPGVLLSDLPRHLDVARQLGADGAHQSRARLSPDAGTESDARSGHSGEDGRLAAGDWPPASAARRQRDAHARRAADAGGPARLADGGHLQDQHGPASVALQAGHRAPDDEGLRRGGRRITRRAQGRGRPQRHAVAVARVAGVQVLEPGRDGTYGGLCPRGVVYNLEVEGTHTYRVGAAGLVAHNCHHAASPSYVRLLGQLGSFDGVPTLGVTATMSRGDKRGLGDVWEDVVYERGITWAIAQGWLVEPRGRVVVSEHLDLNKAKISKGDYQDGELGEMVAQDVEHIVDAWIEHASDRITVAFCPTVASAATLAAEFRRRGIATGEVYGSTPRAERGDVEKGTGIYGRLARGELRVLCSVMVTSEGWDLPQTSCILMARPTKLQGLYTQIVGRGLRTAPGKVDCLVLDVVGASRSQSLVSLIDLHKSAKVNSDELDALPCDECGQPIDECECPPAEPGQRDPDGGRRKLVGPAAYEDVDMFAGSRCRWLWTRQGVRFLPAGDRTFFLWPDFPELAAGSTGDERTTWSVASTMSAPWKHERVEWLADDEGHALGAARELAEAAALELDPTVAKRDAAWRKARRKPSDKMLKLAHSYRIASPEQYTAGALSDEISIVFATARLAQGGYR